MRLKDKIALVTGGAHGLGNAIVKAYAGEGAKVTIADIDFATAKATEEALAMQGKEALSIKVDVTNIEDTKEMARKTVEHFGRIDILVNSAAMVVRVKISRGQPFYELNIEEWNQVMAVNVTGVFLCCRAVFPYMEAQGGGKIVNFTSGTFINGGRNEKFVHYVASKGAIIGLTRALARELGDYDININCIGPGSTLTEDPNDKAAVKMREAAIPARCLKAY